MRCGRGSAFLFGVSAALAMAAAALAAGAPPGAAAVLFAFGGIFLTGAAFLWARFAFGRASAGGLKPAVFWFTGLPASGKTTVAQKLCGELKKRGLKAEHLDGDIIRGIFPATGFSREERDAHVCRVGFLASCLQRNGVFVVTSLISPYETSRRFVRDLCDPFIEIYLSTPIEECERRDPKGLYRKARRGLVSKFTGIDDPYEAPRNPEITINTKETPADEAARRILAFLKAPA